MSLIHAFERALRENPDGAAVRTADRTVCYREFDKLSQVFAEDLRAEVAPGGFVGIEASKGLGAITAMIGALRARRPFVFLDSRDSVASNSEKVRLLGVRRLARSRDDGDVYLTDVPEAWRADESDLARGVLDVEGELCYAIHTSGSTGEPKCVLVRPAPLAAVVRDHVERLSVGPDSRTLQFARLTFDGCMTEILWTLTAGACLVVLDEARLAPGTELRDTLERFGITHLKTTPFALTATEPSGAMRLRHVINGGGACRSAVVAKWSEVAALHNAYGATETTVCNLLTGPLDPASCRDGVPLGDVVGDCAYHLRDIDEGSAPARTDGSVRRGEIVITGPAVAAGYLTEHEVRPFGPAGDGTEYRTGDIAELRDGNLYFVERLDHQVKLRGYRLDLGEIENTVCQAESVVEAVVTVESHDGSEAAGGDALVCYYLGGADPRELRRHLEGVLDPYKIPSVLERVEALPYTLNGKIDRDSLRGNRILGEDAVSTPVQQVLALVGHLTGIGDAVLDDNFYALGGDSASTLLLVAKLRELGWLDAGVRDVLRAKDLRALTDQLRQRSV
ncbi:non-ribosomal peptide synthetase [Streptomyces phyllanthi]|uniref:Non-ribosomal peptide synthetase n=1 Tax=Streptomyces phyllanthi TaxID=1803180 RepID=A0A5N8VVK6_9ACTN|nr:non-ribosomal peptide synthetase [Streptomyces phyllanthi]MPY39303.1 non-ribosomal peptide synthetase [Streptomyces phyllanthi]